MVGIKKLIKKDPRKRALNKYLPPLQNSVFLFGKVGGAKTTTCLSLCQNYKDIHGYKWFYLWGGERNEHLYVSMPNREHNYWNKIKKMFSLDGEGPKQNKVTYIYPFWDKSFPKKLPFDAPNVKSIVMTIPYNSVTLNNIMHVIGTLSSNDEAVWRECLEGLKKKDGPYKLRELSKELSRKNQSIARNFIKPLCDNKLLQSNECLYNLNLKEELENKDTVSVLCLEHIPEEYKVFILEWFLSQMKVICDKSRNFNNNIIMINEAAEFFRATDDSIAPERYKVFRKGFSNYLRMGRRGMHFFLNAQSPHETRGLVSGQDDYTILCKLTSPSDIEISTDHLKKADLIRTDQIQKLYRLEPGQFFFLESGKSARFQYFFKPRTMYWEKGMGDFYRHTWAKYKTINNWIQTKPIAEYIDDLYKKDKEDFENHKKRLNKDIIIEKEKPIVVEDEKEEETVEEKEKLEDEIKEMKIKNELNDPRMYNAPTENEY